MFTRKAPVDRTASLDRPARRGTSLDDVLPSAESPSTSLDDPGRESPTLASGPDIEGGVSRDGQSLGTTLAAEQASPAVKEGLEEEEPPPLPRGYTLIEFPDQVPRSRASSLFYVVARYLILLSK